MMERWRSAALSAPTRERTWMAAARFDAVLSTAAVDDEASESARCPAEAEGVAGDRIHQG